MSGFFPPMILLKKVLNFLNQENSDCCCFYHQALPLVSTFWGVVLFGEYRRSSRRTYILLGFMLFMFVTAVAVLMASSGHRGNE
jgi:hypothetical protein